MSPPSQRRHGMSLLDQSLKTSVFPQADKNLRKISQTDVNTHTGAVLPTHASILSGNKKLANRSCDGAIEMQIDVTTGWYNEMSGQKGLQRNAFWFQPGSLILAWLVLYTTAFLNPIHQPESWMDSLTRIRTCLLLLLSMQVRSGKPSSSIYSPIKQTVPSDRLISF